jgi:hypothetical protein
MQNKWELFLDFQTIYIYSYFVKKWEFCLIVDCLWVASRLERPLASLQIKMANTAFVGLVGELNIPLSIWSLELTDD